MKKALILLLLAGLIAPVFADDALVLPKGISRVTIAPVLGFVQGAWDADGELTSNKDDAGDSLPDDVVFLLGFAYEYGLTEQISLGLQWAPAYQFPVTADAAQENALTGGFEQIDVGAEIQILGEQGYVTNNNFRFSVTPGIAIPFPETTDWKSAGEDFAAQKDALTPPSVNKSEFQLGALLNLDYVITDQYEVNLFTEARYRLGRTLDVGDFYNPVTIAGVQANTGLNTANPALGGQTVLEAANYDGEDIYDSYEITYGPNVLWEIGMEPSASYQVAESLRLDLSATGRFSLSTPQEVETKTELSTEGQAIETTSGGASDLDKSGSVEPDDPSFNFAIQPTVGTFITAMPLPIELKASYNIPVLGQNDTQTQQLIFQIRAFF